MKTFNLFNRMKTDSKSRELPGNPRPLRYHCATIALPLRYVAMILCVLMLGVGQAWGDETLVDINFSSWSDQTICGTATQQTVNGYTFLTKKSGSDYIPFSIASGVMTWCNSNMATNGYYIGIPVTGINNGTITISAYNGSSKASFKYIIKDGATSFSSSLGGSASSEVKSASDGAAASVTISTLTNANKSAYVYIGRGSSTLTTCTRIVISTPAAASTWYVKGGWNDWGTTDNLKGSGTEVSATVNITTAGLYEFKIWNNSGGDGTWYGNTGNIGCNVSGWTFSTGVSANCKFFASETGNYTFTFNTSTKALSVTYPTAQGKYYYKNTGSWGAVYVYRFKGGIDNGWPGTQVVETETICGDTYYFTYADPGTTLIFDNNDGKQTSDMTAADNAGQYTSGDKSGGTTSWTAFTYNVTYDKNGGTGTAPTDATNYSSGESVPVKDNSNLTKSGYYFAGWNTKADGSGDTYVLGQTFSITSCTTLYAKWNAVSCPDGSEEGTVFSLTSPTGTVSVPASSSATITSSQATVSKGLATMVNGQSSAKNLINSSKFNFPNGNTVLRLNLGCALAKGDVISFTDANYKLMVSKTNSTSPGTDNYVTQPSKTENCTIPAGSNLIGLKEVYIVRAEDHTTTCTAITITRPAGCTAPTALAASSVTAKGATLTVTDTAEDGDDYEFYVSTSSTAPTAGSSATHTATGSKSITITSCVANTTYYAWARTKCSSSNKSDWTALTGSTFTTSTVTMTPSLTNVAHTGATSGIGGSDYTAVFTANTGYALPSTITVTIGGAAKTAGTDYTWTQATGTLTIPASKINGNITVTVSSPAAAPSSVSIDGTWHPFPGETITLTATPTGGNGPKTYQWHKGEDAIDGATNATYTKASCAYEDAGDYWCTVTCAGTASKSSGVFQVKILRLYVKTGRNGTDYGNADFVKGDGTTATASISLGSNWDYGFNVADGVGHYYGNSGTMNEGNCTGWTMDNTSQDCLMRTTNAATYIFTVDYSDITAPVVSVTYPSGNQAADKVIYFDNQTVGWSNLYYRIGRTNHTAATAMTKVPGTNNLYKVMTSEYNNFSGWHIGNNCGGTGNDFSIYCTTTSGYELTYATAHEGAAVTASAVTVTPTTSRGNGGDAGINDNCEFYNYSLTTGMKTDNVAISPYSNGTITVNYTNTSGSAATLTSGNADLAHSVILTSITAVADEGYDASAITINGGDYSANHVVTGPTTIAATFTATNYTIAYDLADGSVASPNPTSYTIESEAITLNNPTKTGYTFAGWTGTGLDAATTTVTIAAGSTGNRSYTATWTPVATLYTVTFNSNGGSAVSPIEQASAGANITMPAAPTYASHTFQGWVIGGTTKAAGDSYTPTANVTAYATWKETCAGGGGSGATLFTQNFNSATEVAYEDRAGSKLSITTSSGNNIVGNTAASQFTSITADKKGSTGIAINSASGGNSQSASEIFQAYYNNTGGYWSICKTSDFAATAPTAIKVGMKVWAREGSSSSAVMANFAVGDGFSDGLTSSSPGTSSVHSGFSITNESSMKFAAYNVYNTKIYNTALTQSSWMALTWVINNTGDDLEYDNPNSGKTTVNNDCYDLWLGTTLVAHNIAATTAAKDLQNLYIGSPSGKNHEIRLDDISVVDLSPAGSGCYYVTYNGNGAETGSISDAEAYASGSNVTVLGNTGGSAFTKTGYRFNGWNTSATGNGTAYAAGATISSISANVTLYAQWAADACSAPSAPTISGTSVRTVGQTITLNAACATGADASTTYTWYKGDTWETKSQVQAALTAGEGGRIFNKASCVAGDAGKYWCEASNGDDCEAHNATGFTVTVNAAGEEHIYYYKDADHYDSETDTYYNPEGNTATLKDNQALSSPWTICNGCMTGVDSVVAHGATYDGKGNHMNAYIKIPTDGTATTNNVKFALSAGYTGTLTVKIGGYNSNPTVSLYKLTSVNGAIDGDAVTPTSGEVGGVATTENNFNAIRWPLSTAGGTYVLTVTTKTGYISLIDMTTSTTATFNVTYNGNGNTGGTVPTDATNYASDATVTVAANTGDGKLVKTNYTGAGWNTANNGTGTNYVPGSGQFKITANTTLYAHWTQLITLAPGAQGTGTNNAAVSWNGSVLRGFAAHTASGYALQGYYTEPSGGTKVLNADGSFAATDIDGFVTSGKWSNTGAAPTLYAQWEASNLLKWNLKVNVSETSITTLSKESAAPTVIAVANMGNLTNNGSLTITGSAKSALTSKIATTASAIDADAGKYMSVQFIVAAGYQLVPSDIKVKVQPISHSQTTKLILEDNNSQSISYTSGSLSKGSTHTVTMTNSEEVAFTGTVKLKIYVYGTAESDGYRLGTPIEINGSVEATCATPPTFGGLSYDATEYTVGASASAISVTGAENVNTYAWKQNDVNDRSGGEAASGTNNTVSYTPPTGTIGTKYYWCEMTNTTCGITIKTPAVGIMVRNATTDPTVTWSDVKLNDATATPNYGGGNYVLRATVNEASWPGTLAASMITAPAGITIHHVTTGKADNKNYIEFKFDVTTAFDRASNATIDFNIALPEAGSYSALNSEKSVTYSDCSGGAAGQVAIKMGATASTSKSNPQNYWETAGAGRLMFNYGSNMGSSYNSSGYRTADSTFYYYAASTGQKWMFQTYIGGVNKVRVVFRAAGTIKSSKATITNFYYNTEYFASPGSNAVSFGEVSASKAGYSSGEDGYIEFTVPEMAANSYGAFVTGDGNMKVYGVVLYSENAGGGGSVETNPAWSGGLANDGSAEVNKTQSDANFTYTISTTTNTLGAISYSSSNPSVAAVDPVTGEVTITATGASAQSATITATLARSGCYQGATRTYTINVAGYSCSEPSGSVELTTGSATKCESESVTLTMTGFTEGASIQWYNGESTISNGGGYTITTTATQSTLTTTAAGSYSAIAKVAGGCASGAKRTNTVTIANLDMSEQKTVRKVSQWYVKNGRPTPDIALWQLGEGETFKSVAWSSSNGTGLDFRTDTETGIVYLEGKEPNANKTGNDIEYTLTLTITDACGTDHELSGQTIKLTHQKNTDKHVLAFVVNGTAKGGFTEGITAAQTTSVDLYNAIAAQFDVQATNIYSTDDEQKLREYYSQYDILCITDYPNTQTKGANSKSYVDAIGALIDIRPILTMEAFVSSLSNWKLKGVSGNPKSPTTRQYTMDLQCKDHEIFHGVTTTKIGEGDEAMYRVTVVDKSQEEYKTLDANYGDGEHKANEGYQYGKKPALQGFTYTEEMSENDMLPLGLIDDGAGNKLQVGIERQKEMSARMMVLGINSYAMERLDGDGKTIVINALKYLMKKNAEDISDCSVYFDGSDETDPTNWDNELNWGPSYASLPLPHQEVRILKECVVKDGVVARASGIKIIPRGRINHDTDEASGSLTIEPGGALIVDGKVRAAVAPNYFNATPTTPSNLVLQSNSSAQAALILDNSEGETQATVVVHSSANKDGSTRNWQYLTSPLQETPVTEFFYGVGTYTYKHSEADGGWVRYGLGTTFQAFDAIGLTQNAAKDFVFYGPLAPTGEWELNLTKVHSGNNLFGNSWTAPIDLIALVNNTDFDSNIELDLAIYNTGADKKIGDEFDQKDNADNTAGTWHHVPLLLATLEDAGWEGMTVIPAYQAFQLKVKDGASSATLTIDYDKCVRGSESENYTEPLRAPRRRSAGRADSDIEALRLAVSDAKGIAYIYLLEGEQFTEGYDNGWELEYKPNSKYGKLYAISPEQGDMMALARPSLEGTMVGFQPGESSEYTITFNETDGYYYLNDLKMEQSTLIQAGESYTFSVEEGESANRFLISSVPFDKPGIVTGVTNPNAEAPKAQKVIYNDKLYIIRGGKVFSADGQLVK